MLKHNHRLIYEITESNIPGVTPKRVEMEISGEADINEMLEFFHQYLKAVGYFPPEHSVLDFV